MPKKAMPKQRDVAPETVVVADRMVNCQVLQPRVVVDVHKPVQLGSKAACVVLNVQGG